MQMVVSKSEKTTTGISSEFTAPATSPYHFPTIGRGALCQPKPRTELMCHIQDTFHLKYPFGVKKRKASRFDLKNSHPIQPNHRRGNISACPPWLKPKYGLR